MRNFYLFITIFMLTSCAKKESYGPFNLRDGQEVELLVSHRYGAIGDESLLLPQNQSPKIPLAGFDDREAGYNYKVKAKMVAYHGPLMMDGGPGHTLQFIDVISKERYQGNESFDVSLIRSIVPGPDFIILRKENDKYYYILDEKTELELTYSDVQVGEKLAEIWEFNEKNFYYSDRPWVESKWRVIRATVVHDPSNFGKAYLVSNIVMQER